MASDKRLELEVAYDEYFDESQRLLAKYEDENNQLKKALLEMKDSAESWKSLAQSLYRSGRQEATMEDLSRIKDYMDSLKNG